MSGADFDATQIKIVSDEKDKNILYISLNVVGGDKIAQYGMSNILKNQYGSLLVNPVKGYNATLKLDLTNPDEATKSK